jgi:DNA-binding MarR family transcriptional regulator
MDPKAFTPAVPLLFAVEIRVLTGYIMRQSMRELEQRFEAHQIPLTALQHGILRLLAHDRFTMTELSRKMTLDPSTLVPAIDAMEKRGLLVRERDPSDRRRVPLVVTDAARALLSAMPIVDENDMMVQAAIALGDDDAQRLIALLRALVRQLPEGEALLRDMDDRIALHTRPTAGSCEPDALSERAALSEPAAHSERDAHKHEAHDTHAHSPPAAQPADPGT